MLTFLGLGVQRARGKGAIRFGGRKGECGHLRWEEGWKQGTVLGLYQRLEEPEGREWLMGTEAGGRRRRAGKGSASRKK